jgi:hypothetical protein
VIYFLFYCFDNCDGEPFLFDTAKKDAAPAAGAVEDWGGGEDVRTAESPSW